MATPIHVVLRQDLKNLGKSGDVVRVRPGYARNFLLPRSLAVPATTDNLAHIEDLKRAAIARAARDKAAAEALAVKIGQVSLKITRAVGAENRMYGSVTSKDIEEAVKAQGLELDRRKMQLPEAIRSLGLHEVQIKLHGDITATLRVEVIKQTV